MSARRFPNRGRSGRIGTKQDDSPAASSSSSSSSSTDLPDESQSTASSQSETKTPQKPVRVCATFTVEWKGSIDEFATSPDLTVANLVNSSEALFGEGGQKGRPTDGIIVKGHVNFLRNDLPFDVLISSKSFKNHQIVSLPGQPVKRGLAVAHTGSHHFSGESCKLITHKMCVTSDIPDDYKNASAEDVMAGTNTIPDKHGVPQFTELHSGHVLIRLIRDNQFEDLIDDNGRIVDRRKKYEIFDHNTDRKGIKVKCIIFQEAFNFFMTEISPHLIKEDLTKVKFNLERIGGSWTDPLDDPYLAPQFRTTQYRVDFQLTLAYDIVP